MEVPSAVILARQLIKEVDFFSIGTNDLIQFALAVDRNSEKVSKYFEPLSPAILYMLRGLLVIANEAGKKMARVVFKITVFYLIILMGGGLFAFPRQISGKEADKYIGTLKEKVIFCSYSAIILERRNPHPRTQARVDALLLSPCGNIFRYIRHRDSDHRLKLNVTRGKEAECVTKENISYYERVIEENKLKPHVFFNEEGNEAFIVYCAFIPCIVRWYQDEKGEILFTLKGDIHDRMLRLPWLKRELPLEK